ncbi:winged helix-turn-helix domain-containing protein [Tessaracoccus sp. G1721]
MVTQWARRRTPAEAQVEHPTLRPEFEPCHAPRPPLGSESSETPHVSSCLPLAREPYGTFRPKRGGFEKWASEHRPLIDDVLAEFTDRGPLRIRDLDHPQNVSLGGGWWNKNDVHWAAQYLFHTGYLVTVGRQRFERILAPATAVLPPQTLVPMPKEEAVRELVRRAAVAQGVATLDDLADYPRLKTPVARLAVEQLVADGVLEPVTVDGWAKEAWMPAGQRVPRRIETAALLSPFDPLVWFRPRAERLFDFHYRISIYTPKEQREHGYYVLPVLIDDEIAARVDLKSDRRAGVLRVQHAHIEPAHQGSIDEVATRVAPLLTEAAGWQGLSAVSVEGPGTLARSLSRALASGDQR